MAFVFDKMLFKNLEGRKMELIFKYRSYYVYDFKDEAIKVAKGKEQAEASELYAQIVKEKFSDDEEQRAFAIDKWAFDIALDCIRNLPDEDIADIKKQGKIIDYHFGYGMYVRNTYVYKAKKHFAPMADYISSQVEKFIYAVLNDEKTI